jgi:acyl carrier protein
LISDELKVVILRALDLDDYPINAETLASQVPGWDSLNHIRVITAVEDAFGVRFKSQEVMRLKSIGDLDALVRSKARAPGK